MFRLIPDEPFLLDLDIRWKQTEAFGRKSPRSDGRLGCEESRRGPPIEMQ